MKKEASIITGWQMIFIRILMKMNLTLYAAKHSPNPFHLFRILNKLVETRKKYLGGRKIGKLAKVNGKYYWDLYIPGWKSKAHNKAVESEIFRIEPKGKKANRFINVFIAITSRCLLRCEHCFEWDSLNGSDKMTLPELKTVVNRFREAGTGQIQFTGGEPMLRINDIIEILETSAGDIEFWILTSGYNLTPENANRLKKAGLTGIVVSLDHFEEEAHNKFRGNSSAFEWAENAVKNSVEARLVTALSLCASKEFVNEKNLLQYLNLARELGVSFVQIIEPQAVGRYKDKRVSLSSDQLKILEDFYFRMNHDKAFRAYPIISYQGYFNHHYGCFGAGNRHIYVDTDGDLNPCPFCRQKLGNALTADIEDSAMQFQKKGCFIHQTVDA